MSKTRFAAVTFSIFFGGALTLIVAPLIFSAFPLLSSFSGGQAVGQDYEQVPAISLPPPAAAKGTLRLTYYGDPNTSKPKSASTPAPTVHRTVIVPGLAYAGMEDNDLRGYLDGNFKYAWNQPGQIHVRIGRRLHGPRYGEHELFRVIQRWSHLPLPTGARVNHAKLKIHIEQPPDDARQVLLYAVHRDWNPGAGGVKGNNVSPPKPGEAWWDAARAGQQPWGLPGVGFASATSPNADTGMQFTAGAVANPGAKSLVFQSKSLDAYVGRRVRDDKPLLFLLKLSDREEDVPGSRLKLCSANRGSSKTLAQRPRLSLEWSAPNALATHAIDVHLEHGRALALPGPPPGAVAMAATFRPAPGSGPLTVQNRAQGKWQDLRHPGPVSKKARMIAARNPIAFGQPFVATLHNTWIRTRAPKKQKVPWVFTSPTGATHKVLAKYTGDDRWRVKFVPNELGTWSVVWSQHFDFKPYKSDVTKFDVIPGNRAALVSGVAALAADIDKNPPRRRQPQLGLRYEIRLLHLERALMSFETAKSYQNGGGERVRKILAPVRGRLGKAPPHPIPEVADGPPPWARK